MSTVALSASQSLEIRYRHETTSVGEGRVARLVPIRISLATDDVEEVAAGEA